MDNGNTYEAWVIIRAMLGDDKWRRELKSMNERDRYRKIHGVLIALCRIKKIKLSKDEKTFVCQQVNEQIKELA